MSRMRSSNLAAIVLALIAVAGCARAPGPNDPNVRGIGYVRLEDALKKHPLYPQLSQIQDSIDALNLTALGTPAVPRTSAQIASMTRELNAQLKNAQDRANSILRQKQSDYQAREQAAIRSALAAAGAGTNGTQAVQSMQNVTAQQAQQVASQANADFQQYQQSVLAQDSAAVKNVSDQLSARADRQYRQK